MGDTHPLANNEVLFTTMDIESPHDLNNTDDATSTHRFGGGGGHDRKSSGILSPYSVNGRLVVIAIAGIAFLLSLALFIATVVVYAGGSSSSSSSLKDCAPLSTTPLPSPVFPAVSTPATITTTSRNNRNPFDETLSVTRVNGRNVAKGSLVWSDEFESFDMTRWAHLNHDPESNFFHLVNNRSNSFVKDGILHLKPTFTSDAYGADYIYNGTLFLGRTPSALCKDKNDSALCWKGHDIAHPIMAPVISTQESFTFRYGKLEIRAKMPAGDWIEPLMTMHPNESVYGDGGMMNGQVQIIDIRGNRKLFDNAGINIGSEQNCPDIRFGNTKLKRYIFDCLNTPHDAGFDTDFHNYTVEWTPKSLSLKIDGEGIVSAPFPRNSMFDLWSRGRVAVNPWATAENPIMAPFDRNFYLILGIHVGGTKGFFSEEHMGPYPKPWNDHEPERAARSFWEARSNWESTWAGDSGSLQIDYIRLYALNQTLIEEERSSDEEDDHDNNNDHIGEGGYLVTPPDSAASKTTSTDSLSSDWNNFSEEEEEEDGGSDDDDEDFYEYSLYPSKHPHHHLHHTHTHTHNTRNNNNNSTNSTQITGLEEAIIDNYLD